MKPGWKTTEFWASLSAILGNVAAAIAGVLPAETAGIVSAVVAALYALARGLAKQGSASRAAETGRAALPDPSTNGQHIPY